MSLLPPATVAALQGLMRAYTLPDVCALVLRQVAADGAGGLTESWAEGSALPCRLSPLGPRPTEGAVGGAVLGVGQYRLVLDPADAIPLRPPDRVHLTSLRGAACDRTFEVVGSLGDKSWAVVHNWVVVELL